MAQRPAMTKSPLTLATLAFQTAQQTLPAYSDLRSRHDFTQAQIFALLVLRQFFKTDYRGMIRILQDTPKIREALGLTKLPHFTTLQKAHQRMLKKTSSRACLQQFSTRHETAA